MKLLFFDIDGTLVDGKTQTIPESAKEGIKLTHEKGNKIFINTGRCKSFIPACLKEIPIDGYCYACGSHIEYHDQVLFEKYVSKEDMMYIRDALKAADIQGIFQGPEYCYFGDYEKLYDNLAKFMEMYKRDYHAEYRSMEEDDMVINKLVTFRVEHCLYDEFVEKLNDKYQLIDNGGGFTEILPLPYTKASCMDFLMEYFGVTSDDCYVFGDSPNDLPMMTHIKNSIALGDGYDEVKEVSGYVTTPLLKDGIYVALKHYGLI